MRAAASRLSGPVVLRLSLVASAFLAIHFAILQDRLSWAVALIFCSLALTVAAGALRRGEGRRLSRSLLAVALLALAASSFWWRPSDARMALILPPLLGYIMTSAIFGFSLLPGQKPVIVRMCHVTQGETLPEGLEAYARALTFGWALLPILFAIVSLLVLLVFGLSAWSWFCNILSPLLLAAFFIGEHFYRAWRLPHVGKPSILRTLVVLLDTASWQRR